MTQAEGEEKKGIHVSEAVIGAGSEGRAEDLSQLTSVQDIKLDCPGKIREMEAGRYLNSQPRP